MPGERTLRRLKAIEKLIGVLKQHAATAGGRVFAPGTTVTLPSGDVVYPDAVYLRKPLRVADGIIGAPDLIVQILHNSSPEGERVLKKVLYEQNGVDEYWILDAMGSTIEVFALEGRAYRAVGYFASDSVLQSPGLTGLSIPVGPLFA
jgi:Uma2 family endonuclease